MADIEKVVTGLEKCIADEYCDDCPYTDDCFEIDEKPYGEQLMRDALELLKEQETDIGNLNETVKNLLNAYTEIKAIYMDSVRVVGELVRCKDCKHWKEGVCFYSVIPSPCPNKDWFCADGERRETDA